MLRRALRIATLFATLLGSQSASAQGTTTELRFELFNPTYVRPSSGANDENSGFYFVPTLGARVFPKQPNHGLLVDYEWLGAGINKEQGPRYHLWHLGYGYRFLAREAGNRRLLLTPHASLSLGNQRLDRYAHPFFVVGARLGFDVDLHFPKRFFFGWGVRYEVVTPTREAAPTSHLASWNVLPLRMGVDLGRTPPFSSTEPRGTEPFELDVQRAQRGRLLLAGGVPILAAGTAGLAVGLAANCRQSGDLPQEAVVAGANVAAAGLGLSVAGIVQMVQASKEARKTRMTRRQRSGVIVTATFSTIGSAILVSIASFASIFGCNPG